MFPYNLVETQAQRLVKECTARGIGFIAMKPLAGGAIDDAALALRYLANDPDLTVAIPGMAEAREIAQNVAAMNDSAPLTAQELQQIEKIRNSLGTQFCRRCNYCAPCTAGIPISAVFLMEGYYTRYDLKEWAQARYDGLAGHATDCVECGVCESRCPYNLPIRQMLKNAAAIFGK